VSTTFEGLSARHRSGTDSVGIAAAFIEPPRIARIGKTPKFQGFSSTMRIYEDRTEQLGKLPFCH
jgi:hypothetical protein